MKKQLVTSGGMMLSALRTTTGLVTGQPATTQPNSSGGSSKLRRAIGPLLAAAVMLQAAAVLGGPPAYTFQPITFVGGPTPGGSRFNQYFIPSAINNRGEFAFTADYMLNSNDGEGVFIGGAGIGLRQVLGFGQPAPGTGGLFGPWAVGNFGFSDEGDLAIAFTLDPGTHWWTWFSGFYGGVWRYSHVTQQLTPVVVTGDPIPGPGGGTFKGIGYDLGMNNQGAIAFEGIVSVSPLPPLGSVEGVDTQTAGVFVASTDGTISAVALPGGPAPDGGTWDTAINPSINAAGDVAFGGALVGPYNQSVYLRKAATGEILAVGKPGPAPGGGTLLDAWQPKMNDRGDVVFSSYMDGEPLSPMDGPVGVFLYTGGTVVRVAAPGDAMPGGGHLAFATSFENNMGLNNSGTVIFTGALDTFTAGMEDEGLYAWSHGSLRLIARTGTVIPGVGTLSNLEMGIGYPIGSGRLNDRGQLVFGCDLTDGRTVLLLATPTGVK